MIDNHHLVYIGVPAVSLIRATFVALVGMLVLAAGFAVAGAVRIRGDATGRSAAAGIASQKPVGTWTGGPVSSNNAASSLPGKVAANAQQSGQCPNLATTVTYKMA